MESDMTDLTKISSRMLAMSLSSNRQSLLAGSMPAERLVEARERVVAIRAELERRKLARS